MKGKHKMEMNIVEQNYLRELIDKFNINPNDPSFSDHEKRLLILIREINKEISNISQDIDKINSDIRTLQSKGDSLLQKLLKTQGQNQGIIDALLALRR
jgi:peptidoglycan hydrolase CwlO-like protein